MNFLYIARINLKTTSLIGVVNKIKSQLYGLRFVLMKLIYSACLKIKLYCLNLRIISFV